MTEDFMTRQEAADYLHVSMSLLETFAWRGTGPKFYKLGSRTVRYYKRDLMEWLEAYKAAKHSKTK